MGEIEEIEEEMRTLHWLPLPREIMDSSGLEIGDWVLIRSSDDGFSLEKVETGEITLEIDTELLEMALTVRDMEKYYTLEETLSNMIRKGLALLLRERGEEEESENYEDSWLVQIHSK